jgi:hypothetical protein
MKSKEMIQLELKEEILSIKIHLNLKEATNLICNLFNDISPVCLYEISLKQDSFSFPGLFDVKINEGKVNLIDLIKSIKQNQYRLGIIEGKEIRSKEFKNQLKSLFYLANLEIDNE